MAVLEFRPEVQQEWLGEHCHIEVVGPTRSGKTAMLHHLAECALQRGERVLVANTSPPLRKNDWADLVQRHGGEVYSTSTCSAEEIEIAVQGNSKIMMLQDHCQIEPRCSLSEALQIVCVTLTQRQGLIRVFLDDVIWSPGVLSYLRRLCAHGMKAGLRVVFAWQGTHKDNLHDRVALQHIAANVELRLIAESRNCEIKQVFRWSACLRSETPRDYQARLVEKEDIGMRNF